ncbi:retrovirus-related pol polyprotein from transposon TNT 1-94 [Tanacetum coccineum]
MDLKLEYQTFRAKPFESLSQTYTQYKTLLNKLTNDGVALSKHKINVGSVNSLLENWLSFSQGLRNANYTQTLVLADIYGRFVFEDNSPKPFQSKNKCLVTEMFDWDKKEVSDYEEMTQVKVLMALADDELFCRDDLLALKQAKLEADTFQNQNTELTKLNHALQDQLKEGRKVNEKWLNNSNKVKRHNPDSKLPNFNTGRIIVPESQAINECLKLTKASTDPESFKESGSEPQTPIPPLKNLQGASPRSKVMALTYQDHSPRERPGLGIMTHTKSETQESSSKIVLGIVNVYDTEPVTSSVPTEVKINDQESKIDERTKLVRGGVLAESSQSSGSSISVSCNTCGSNVHSTNDHSDFEHFNGETHQEAHLVPGQWMLKEYDWCQELSAQICRATRMVENQNNVKVKQIRTDNKTEFRNSKLEIFCDKKEISHNFSSPYTPEQNGVAERKNRTLIEAARTMLNGLVLSKHLWTEV